VQEQKSSGATQGGQGGTQTIRQQVGERRKAQEVANQYRREAERRRQEFFIKLSTEGWIQNPEGKFFRDPDVEWDSDDDEVPVPPPGIRVEFIAPKKK
jgi:hypothetical protein